MKKLLILVLMLFLVTACGKKADETVDYEKYMNEYATTYYSQYVKGKVSPTPDRFEVSIEKLREANERINADFDLGKLASCNDVSKVTLVLDDEGEITSYDFALECE